MACRPRAEARGPGLETPEAIGVVSRAALLLRSPCREAMILEWVVRWPRREILRHLMRSRQVTLGAARQAMRRGHRRLEEAIRTVVAHPEELSTFRPLQYPSASTLLRRGSG